MNNVPNIVPLLGSYVTLEVSDVALKVVGLAVNKKDKLQRSPRINAQANILQWKSMDGGLYTKVCTVWKRIKLSSRTCRESVKMEFCSKA